MAQATGRLVPLANPSFEADNLGAGAYTRTIPGWNQTGGLGEWNPNGAAPATDGSSVAYLEGNYGYSAIVQDAGTFVAGTTYTFYLDVANRTDVGANPAGRVAIKILRRDAQGSHLPT